MVQLERTIKLEGCQNTGKKSKLRKSKKL